jgi:hypothetical protein
VLYGSGYPYNSPDLYSINPANGALTLVSNNFSPGFRDLGSTTAGLFAMGGNANLYSITQHRDVQFNRPDTSREFHVNGFNHALPNRTE